MYMLLLVAGWLAGWLPPPRPPPQTPYHAMRGFIGTSYNKKDVEIMNIMFFYKGENLFLSATHHTVCSEQGSRGSAADQRPNANITCLD
jgi:hypothetical protein